MGAKNSLPGAGAKYPSMGSSRHCYLTKGDNSHNMGAAQVRFRKEGRQEVGTQEM